MVDDVVVGGVVGVVVVVVGVGVVVVVVVAVDVLLTVVVRDAGLIVVVNGSVAGRVLIWKPNANIICRTQPLYHDNQRTLRRLFDLFQPIRSGGGDTARSYINETPTGIFFKKGGKLK